MNDVLVELNREYVKTLIGKEVDKLFNDIKKNNNLIEELKKDIKKLKENNLKLAKAYAKKIGVIMTQKQFNKKYVKTAK